MLGKLGAYVIAFVILAGKEILAFPFTMGLSTVVRKRTKWVAPFVSPLLDVVTTCCAVLIAAWLIRKIGQSPTWLMFPIPGGLMVENDLMRINRVKAGRSNVKRLLEQRGEPESYDQRHDLWVERRHLLGDAIGWIVGTTLVLQSASFF
jgi:hypothetical protein